MQPPVTTTLARPSLASPVNGRLAAAKSKYQRDGAGAMSKGQVLVLLYQRLLRDLDAADAAIARRDIEGAHTQLIHAQDIIDGLDHALDRNAWGDAEQLSSLYGHVRNELVAANITKDSRIIARCRQILQPLAETWQEALQATLVPTANVAVAS